MHERKTGICYFWDDYGKVLSLTRFANDPFTLYNQLNAGRLARIRKDEKVWIWVKRNAELFL